MEPVIFVFAGALALIAVLRTPRLTAPQLAGPLPVSWTGPNDGDEDEQRPETDRADPVRRPLLWAVAALALVRVLAFAAFHA